MSEHKTVDRVNLGRLYEKMISFELKEYEISLFHSLLWELDSMVDGLISQEIRKIVEKALLSGEISKDDLERLLKLLPQLEILETESVDEVTDSSDDINDDWPEWEKAQTEKHRRHLLSIQQQLSNWLFTQYALYQKQLTHKRKLSSPLHMTTQKKGVENNL